MQPRLGRRRDRPSRVGPRLEPRGRRIVAVSPQSIDKLYKWVERWKPSGPGEAVIGTLEGRTCGSSDSHPHKLRGLSGSERPVPIAAKLYVPGIPALSRLLQTLTQTMNPNDELFSIAQKFRGVANEIEAREVVFRNALRREGREMKPPWARKGRTELKEEEVEVWRRLDRGDLSEEEAVDEVTAPMEEYYSLEYPL